MSSALEDKDAIREVMARYCHALDQCRFADVAALFAPDGEWTTDYGTARGRAEIEALLRSVVPVKGEGPQRKHYITNIIIAPEAGTARAVSDYLVVRESGAWPPAGDGWYLQRLLRQAGRKLVLPPQGAGARHRRRYGAQEQDVKSSPPPLRPPVQMRSGLRTGLSVVISQRTTSGLTASARANSKPLRLPFWEDLMHRRYFLCFLSAALTAGFTAGAAAQSENWPTRPVKLLLPYAPGGATDQLGRPWADKLGQAFGQQFVVENRGGASGMIGAEAAAKSPPDGYTFLFTPNAPLSVLPSLRKTPYDPITSFEPVGRAGDVINGFVIHPGVGIKTFQEMIDYAKKIPASSRMPRRGREPRTTCGSKPSSTRPVSIFCTCPTGAARTRSMIYCRAPCI